MAIAAAIRLLPRIHSIPLSAAVGLLAAAALALSGGRALRIAASILVAVAVIDLGTLALAGRTGARFAQESAQHADGAVQVVRARIAADESELQRSAERVAAALPHVSSPAARFQLLRQETRRPGRGMRIVASNGQTLAWWGEESRVSGAVTYQFDVTSLYITRSIPVPAAAVTVQSFERVVNEPPSEATIDVRDDWIAGATFHAGVLRQEPGARRYEIEQRPDSNLDLDVVPRTRADVVGDMTDDGADLAAALLAIGALLLAWEFRKRSVIVPSVLIAAARAALLPLSFDSDPWNIFGFELYASRLLDGFSKSPFDLLLTAAAVLTIVLLWSARPPATRSVAATRVLAALAAAVGFVIFLNNLVDNSRIAAVPDHIVPASVAQAVLLLSLLMFAFAVVAIAPRWPRRRELRLTAAALAAVVLIYVPLQAFESASSRTFTAETYAPLVIGESDQLRTMIEDTLRNEFSSLDLSTILPDDLARMDLQDLAYALWLRSDLSKWRIPAVISVHDAAGQRISRFGVGLPQFSERRSEAGHEVLQLGSLRRILLHHTFELTDAGTSLGRGDVHVVNPADPGAAAYADTYRDFFEPSFADTTIALRTQPRPVVYERNGTAHGVASFQLPLSPSTYFATLQPGHGEWVTGSDSAGSEIYLRRAQDVLYAFPLQVPTLGEHVRRAGGLAIWAIAFALAAMIIRALPAIASVLRRLPRSLDFRTRTSIYITAVVILPLVVFVISVRAYLGNRLQKEYEERAQTALNAAQRVIVDYLASTNPARPEQVLDDDVLSWLALVIGHDLHLYHDQQLIASSRRDLFAAHVDSERLPGDVYAAVVLHGRQLFLARRSSGSAEFVEIYSPVILAAGQNYTLALPFIVQGRLIRAQVNDLATTIYMLLVFILLAAIVVATRTARSITRPIQALVGGARAVARGDFDIDVTPPSDPDVGLLVATFRDMAQSIRRQQSDLRHERDRLQTLLENITAAVVVLDGAMQPGATNLAARRLFGDPIRFPVEVRDFLAGHTQQHTESAEMEVAVDQNARTFRISIVPLPESDEEMLIAEDVTEILRSNRLEAWGEMARQVAHEIKNPLTPIQLTAEHLRAVAARNDPRLPEVVGSAVDNILRQVVTLRETSKEFGDYASLRQLQRSSIDLRGLLQEIASSYAGSGERGIDFHADIAPTTPSNFAGDPRMIRGAIANLIENAFQAAPGGTVRLSSQAVDSKVVVSVEDNGPGVPQDVLPRIFDPYFSTKSAGTGLGLAITRKTIEEHGGAVHAENLNPGFRVSIELPMR